MTTGSQGRLTDSHGRQITYLRLSITDRCNLRCFYCMPQADFNWMPPQKILRFEEIVQIVRVLASQGVKKVRFTGGEPLVRKDVVKLVADVSSLVGIEEVCLTTNGVLLRSMANGLYDAGLRHLNISLDTLKPERFLAITGRDFFDEVWKGIEKCIHLGFSPVKINFVMMRGKNDDEIVDFVRLTERLPIDVRFIEFMPIGKHSKWGRNYFISSDEALGRIEKEFGRLLPVERTKDSGPAQMYRFEKGKGKIGFISPLSHRFCSSCNRLRITADGRVRLCLFSDIEIGLRERLRKGVTDDGLAQIFSDIITKKPARYLTNQTDVPSCNRQMSSIGG